LRSRIGLTLLAVVFAVLCAADVWQLGQVVQGRHPDPPALIVTHGVTGAHGRHARRAWAGPRHAAGGARRGPNEPLKLTKARRSSHGSIDYVRLRSSTQALYGSTHLPRIGANEPY
jgi:hypothetical protein